MKLNLKSAIIFVGKYISISCIIYLAYTFTVCGSEKIQTHSIYMDYIITSRLADPVVEAQKEALTFRLNNSKNIMDNKEVALFLFYRGLCSLYFSNFKHAEIDFKKAWEINKREDYKLYMDITSVLRNNKKNYAEISTILNKNKRYARTVFCRLKGPPQLRHLFETDAKSANSPSLEDIYFDILIFGKNNYIDDPVSLIRQKKIDDFILSDPYTLFYLKEIFKIRMQKLSGYEDPNKKSSVTNDLLYVYINFILNKKRLPDNLKCMLHDKYTISGEIPMPILETCFALAVPEPDYKKAFSKAAQYIYNHTLTPKFDPNHIRILFYLDFAIVSYYVQNMNWAYTWILTHDVIEERYDFLKVSNYYLGWSLYKF
ncbi:hypothetical protein GMMP13_170022 [Candidatus Magnetomoraceae bacterium gMMP-13]